MTSQREDILPIHRTEAAQLPPRLWPLRNVIGSLGLSIEHGTPRDFARRQTHDGYMRITRPHYVDDSGQVYYTVMNPGGGFFGGDDYRMDIHVGEDASLLLTDQSATTVYKTPDDYCMQEMNIVLDKGALFEWMPCQLIAYKGATYHQNVRVDMHPEATLMMAEVVTPGWAPDGSHFMYDEVRVRSAINVAGEPKVLDNLIVRPGTGEFEKNTLLFLEDQTHLGTLTVVDRRMDKDLVTRVREVAEEAAEASSTKLRWAASITEGPGLAMRVIGSHTYDIQKLLYTVVSFLRGEFGGYGPLNLRRR